MGCKGSSAKVASAPQREDVVHTHDNTGAMMTPTKENQDQLFGAHDITGAITNSTNHTERQHTMAEISDSSSPDHHSMASTPHALIQQLCTMREESEEHHARTFRHELDGLDQNRGVLDSLPPVRNLNHITDIHPLPERSSLTDDIEGCWDYKGYYAALAIKGNDVYTLFRKDGEVIPDSYAVLSRGDSTSESPELQPFKFKKAEKIRIASNLQPGSMQYFLHVYKEWTAMCIQMRLVMRLLHQPKCAPSVSFTAFNMNTEPYAACYKTNNDAAINFKDRYFVTSGVFMASDECKASFWNQFAFNQSKTELRDEVFRHTKSNAAILKLEIIMEDT